MLGHRKTGLRSRHSWRKEDSFVMTVSFEPVSLNRGRISVAPE